MDWYNDEKILSLFNHDRKHAVKLYREYVRKPLKEDEKEYPVYCWGQIVAGSKSFYEQILKGNKEGERMKRSLSGRRRYSGENTIKNVLKKYKLDFEDIQMSSKKVVVEKRRILCYLLKFYCHWPSKRIQEKLGINKMKLSRDIRKIESVLKN